MTDKKRKKARELQAKTGMSYAAAINQINTVPPIEEAPIDLQYFSALRDAFCLAVTEQVSKWYSDVSAKIVEDKADVTACLSDDELKALKTEVLGIIANTKNAVRAHLDVDALWWHSQQPLPVLVDEPSKGCWLLDMKKLKKPFIGPTRRETHKWNYDARDTWVPGFIDFEIGKVLGVLASVLERYGYRRTHVYRGDYIVEVRVDTMRGPYPETFEWSQSMRALLCRYSEAQTRIKHNKALALSMQYDEQRRLAKKRWDSL